MDTIAQFLTVIRNANQAKHEKVDVPSSKMREGIAKVLVDSGYIRSYKIAKDHKQGIMRIYLKYDQNGNTVMNSLDRVSTPGRRVYVNFDKIPTIRSGMGMTILSTNKGILNGKDAAAQNVGGELLCTVW